MALPVLGRLLLDVLLFLLYFLLCWLICEPCELLPKLSMIFSLLGIPVNAGLALTNSTLVLFCKATQTILYIVV